MSSMDLARDEISPQQWRDFLGDILPPQGAWSEENYLALTDTTPRLVEFTDGFLEPLPMPTDRHQTILKFLFLAFHMYIAPRGGTVQFAALRLRIRPGKFREPDLILLQSASDPRRQNRCRDKPERDLIEMLVDYAEGRVPEYWIVDPQTETITVLRLEGDSYLECGRFRRGDRATSVLLPEFSLEVNSVLDAR